jgi:hypothetical protein
MKSTITHAINFYPEYPDHTARHNAVQMQKKSETLILWLKDEPVVKTDHNRYINFDALKHAH